VGGEACFCLSGLKKGEKCTGPGGAVVSKALRNCLTETHGCLGCLICLRSCDTLRRLTGVPVSVPVSVPVAGSRCQPSVRGAQGLQTERVGAASEPCGGEDAGWASAAVGGGVSVTLFCSAGSRKPGCRPKVLCATPLALRSYQGRTQSL